MNKDTQLENLFSSAFGNEEAAPPAALMGGIFSTLDSQRIEDIYSDAFRSEEVAPSPSVWPRIARALWLTGFLSFSYNRLNIYYVAGAIGAASLLLIPGSGSVSLPETAKQILHRDAITAAAPVKQAASSAPAAQMAATVPVSAPVAPRASSVNVSNGAPVGTPSVKTPAAVAYHISGAELVCIGTKQAYILQPASAGSYIAVDSSSARIMADGTVQFVREGRFTVAYIDAATRTQLASMEVNAHRPLAAEILGDSLLCQGAPGQTFRVNSRLDIGIQYNWDLAANQHKIIGNGFMSVMANNAGTDTVYLTQIDRNTGCISYRKRTIKILPRPDAQFTATSNGNLIVEVQSAKRNGTASEWTVDGEKTALSGKMLKFDNDGIYHIGHFVKDANGCSDSAFANVSVESYSLFVPNAFAPNVNRAEFKPIGNGIAEYRIEIFNADNVKLWESTALANGQPSQSWDGYFNGEMQKPGAYYFTIYARFENGAEWKGIERGGSFSRTGTFFLMQK